MGHCNCVVPLLLLPPPPPPPLLLLLLLLLLLQVSTDGCNPYHRWESDYRAARKDSNRLWSWKEPGGPASNKDLFGNLIKDPETPNVTVHYDVFCGYYHVVPSEMTIDAETSGNDMSIADRLKYYGSGMDYASFWAEPIPYNETADAAHDPSIERVLQQDRLWESQRGSKEWEEWQSKNGATNGEGSSAPSR
jgi:hypothetical protein